MKNKVKCKIKKSWVDAELKEHGDLFIKGEKRKMAKKIAEGHVMEMGCRYYPELFKLEKKLNKK